MLFQPLGTLVKHVLDFGMENSVLGRNRHVVDFCLRVVMLDAAAAQNVNAGALDGGKNQVGKIYDLAK